MVMMMMQLMMVLPDSVLQIKTQLVLLMLQVKDSLLNMIQAVTQLLVHISH
jgi:hypothetical protein